MTKLEQDSSKKVQAKKQISSDRTPSLSTDRNNQEARDVIGLKQEIETLQEILLANREVIRRVKLEKRELLKTNFVGL